MYQFPPSERLGEVWSCQFLISEFSNFRLSVKETRIKLCFIETSLQTEAKKTGQKAKKYFQSLKTMRELFNCRVN